MIEKLKAAFTSGKKKEKRRSKEKFLIPSVIIFSLALGIIIAALLNKPLIILFLPLASLTLALLFKKEKITTNEEKSEKEKLIDNFTMFISMSHDGKEAMQCSLNEMDICDTKDEILASVEKGMIDSSLLIEEQSFLSSVKADKCSRLYLKEDITSEDINELTSLNEGSRKEIKEDFPLVSLVLVIIISLLALGGFA